MFSVVIPVYNQAPTLTQAVLSAASSPLVHDVHVMDDGSSDHSARLLDLVGRLVGPRFRNHTTQPSGPHRGAPACLNFLCERATGPWIAVLDCDDTFTPGRFFQIQQRLRLTPVDMIFGALQLVGSEGHFRGVKRGPLDPEAPFPNGIEVERLMTEGNWLDLLAHQNFLHTPSNLVFTKALWQGIGGFRPYPTIYDWDFALRAALIGRLGFLPFPMTVSRPRSRNGHETSDSRAEAEVALCFRTLLADYPILLQRPLFRLSLSTNREFAALSAPSSSRHDSGQGSPIPRSHLVVGPESTSPKEAPRNASEQVL